MSAVATPLVIGVTGHRNIPAHEIEPIRQRVRDFLAGLQRDFPNLPLVVLSSLAAGGDQLVAEVAQAVGARLVAPLPFARDIYTQDFGGSDRVRFDALCARAELLQLPLLPGVTVADIAERGPARDRQYAQAGVFVASHCHILLALWDGRSSDLLGGTGQVVHYLLNGIMPGWIERRQSHRVTLDSGDESLLYHIACSRSDGNGGISPPLPPLQPLQTRWISEERTWTDEAGMPQEFRRMFARMQQFNDDAARYADDIHAGVSPDEEDAGIDRDGRVSIDSLFAASDRLAIRFQKQVLFAMRSLYVLAALMGIAFICYSDLPPDLPYIPDAIYVFVLLFAAGVWLAWLTRRRQWHRKYIDYRALAEGLRVQDYWRRAGIEADDPGAFAHDNFMQKQDVELGWIRNVMRAAGIQSAGANSKIDLAAVIAEWIGASGGEGQLGYYARKAEQRHRIHDRTQRLSRILLTAVIAASVFLAAFHHWLDSDTATYLVALMGVLAITAATRESYAYRKADKELIKQYRHMRGIFASARRKLDAVHEPRGQRDILRALGEAALAEHAQWALMHRERPLEHGKL
ncbi:MAG: hypothetical protein ACREPU_10680 [Rhodanobacteraceae bacterium]